MATVDLGSHKNRLTFMEKLTHILSSPFTDVVTWSNDGTSFIVRDLKRFSNEVLPQYFRTSNAQSFQRQLNYYGFRKVTHVSKGGGKATVYEFRHDKFHRGALHLAKDIKRRVGVDVNQVKEQARSELDAMKARCDKLEREARKWKTKYEEAAAKLARLQKPTPRASRKRARVDVGLTPMVMPGSSAAPFPSVPMPYDDMYESDPEVPRGAGASAAAPSSGSGSGTSSQPSAPPTSPPLSPSIGVDAMLNLSLDDSGAPPPPAIAGLPVARSVSGLSMESFDLDPTLADIGDLASGADLAWFDHNPASPTVTRAAAPAATAATTPIPTKTDLQELPPEVQQRMVARLVAAMLGRYLQQSHTLAQSGIAPLAPSPPTTTAIVPVTHHQTAVNQLESLVVASPPEAFLQCLLQLPALQQLHLGTTMTAAPMAAAHG